MTAKELQKRNERSQHLRVIQVDEDTYYVESSEGKICYRVMFEGDSITCTCGDFSRGIKADANFRCKHIISVFNSIPNGEVQHGQMLERSKPKLDERFIIKIENKDFVQYAGLLDLGHQKGISQIEVEPIQLPNQDNGNFAICKATVVSDTGKTYTDLGDANPQNVTSKVSRHLLRMASTRAIARALRSFTNIGMTCLEELADLSDLAGGGEGNSKSKPKAGKPAARIKPAVQEKGREPEKTPTPVAGKIDETKTQHPVEGGASSNNGNGNGAGPKQKEAKPPKAPDGNGQKPAAQPMMSEAQKRAIYNLSRRRGISVDGLQKMAIETYGVELEHLSSRDASTFIRSLQQAA
jgi:hypothetical protein